MTLFLSKEELADLTGLVRKSAQIRWLRDHGYLCEVDARGRPRVLMSHVMRKLGGDVQSEPRKPRPHPPKR